MYKALPDCVTVRESQIHGLGLFATKDIKSGSTLGISHIREKSGEFENDYIRTPLGGFINHSADPNCYKANMGERIISLVTLRDIKKGDELTVFYTLYSIASKSKVGKDYDDLLG